ncbi:hypothetical protein GQ53DRAFT_740840 [Thozetella sp. PMI_491]|nr:hypothetical protein GQ53DRAFT_740840 [Thozetella sp. PMI_491]
MVQGQHQAIRGVCANYEKESRRRREGAYARGRSEAARAGYIAGDGPRGVIGRSESRSNLTNKPPDWVTLCSTTAIGDGPSRPIVAYGLGATTTTRETADGLPSICSGEAMGCLLDSAIAKPASTDAPRKRRCEAASHRRATAFSYSLPYGIQA